jgi:hypothetical protein
MPQYRIRTDKPQIKDIVVELQRPQNIETGAVIPMTLIEPNILMQDGTNHTFAKLVQRMATIIRNLMAQCNLQLFCRARAQVGKGEHGAGGLKSKKQMKTGIILCVNVYGPRNMAEAVGEFFTDCGMHLQDPMHCDRDVVYCNPHLLYNDEEPATTLTPTCLFTAPDIEQIGKKPDLFELLRNEQPLPETDTPASLSTQLYR